MSEVLEGVVVYCVGKNYYVLSNFKTYPCVLRGKLKLEFHYSTNPITVGDIVKFEWSSEMGIGKIFHVEERKNAIIRRATNESKILHVIAANIDLACLIVTPLMPYTSTGFIDRFLITAEAYHIPAILVFNKYDLYQNDASIIEPYIEIYHKFAGYSYVLVSATTGFGLKKFYEHICGKTVLLAGNSGVGKSTLINALEPSLRLKVADISRKYLKGKHTTTFTQLHLLKDGTRVIDTPGIKEFGVVNFEPWELGHWYREFEPYINKCSFSNCTHWHEPGCAVRRATEEGKIHPERYNNYLKILQNIKDSEQIS
ncbi:MAG: ribosome small subunit-dependent GTPase A [Bacteroidales bacterium]|nr:ribosome small subunit-dependent GTPase A [Bacteroidales bacterium]